MRVIVTVCLADIRSDIDDVAMEQPEAGPNANAERKLNESIRAIFTKYIGDGTGGGDWLDVIVDLDNETLELSAPKQRKVLTPVPTVTAEPPDLSREYDEEDFRHLQPHKYSAWVDGGYTPGVYNFFRDEDGDDCVSLTPDGRGYTVYFVWAKGGWRQYNTI